MEFPIFYFFLYHENNMQILPCISLRAIYHTVRTVNVNFSYRHISYDERICRAVQNFDLENGALQGLGLQIQDARFGFCSRISCSILPIILGTPSIILYSKYTHGQKTGSIFCVLNQKYNCQSGAESHYPLRSQGLLPVSFAVFALSAVVWSRNVFLREKGDQGSPTSIRRNIRFCVALQGKQKYHFLRQFTRMIPYNG